MGRGKRKSGYKSSAFSVGMQKPQEKEMTVKLTTNLAQESFD